MFIVVFKQNMQITTVKPRWFVSDCCRTIGVTFWFDKLVPLENAPRHKMAALLSRLFWFSFGCVRENNVQSDSSSLFNSTTVEPTGHGLKSVGLKGDERPGFYCKTPLAIWRRVAEDVTCEEVLVFFHEHNKKSLNY